jgi:hypothetical protein
MKKNQLEDQHQITLMQWADTARINRYMPGIAGTISDYLIHIPNGGSRHKIEAVKLKRMGVKAGVSDLLLTIPSRSKAGLWIEMKAPAVKGKSKNYPTQSQNEWLAKMKAIGYAAVVCYGWEQAKDQIIKYFGEANQ